MTAKILCIANQKGGVGKTTTAVNICAGLAHYRKRVLLIDLDPQGNATMGSGIDKRKVQQGIYQVLLGLADIESSHQFVQQSGYSVLPANKELAGAEIELVRFKQRELRLKKALKQIKSEYDYMVIDCPPALSLLTLNALCSSDEIIIPMQCEYFALEGLSDLVSTIKQVRMRFNPRLNILGLLRVMFDTRITLQQQVSEQLKQHFKDKVFNTIIPRNIRLAEAPSYAVPGIVFDMQSRGAKAYLQFSEEVLTY